MRDALKTAAPPPPQSLPCPATKSSRVCSGSGQELLYSTPPRLMPVFATKKSSGWNTFMGWCTSRLPLATPPRRPLPQPSARGQLKQAASHLPSPTDVSCEPGRVFTSPAKPPPVPESSVRTTFLHFSSRAGWDAAEDYLLTTAGTERRNFSAERPQEDLEDPCLERTGLVHLVIFIFPPTYSSVISTTGTDGRRPGAAPRTCRHDVAKDGRQILLKSS